MADLDAKVAALINEQAASLANHDGVPVQPVHIFGAASDLVLAVGRVRDQLMAPSSPAPIADVAPEPAPAPQPKAATPVPAASAPPAPKAADTQAAPAAGDAAK